MALSVVWSQGAVLTFRKALEFIAEDSLHGAESVASGILLKIEEARLAPERFPADKYKQNNSGDFRAFETHSFRVSYRIMPKHIRIVRLRHVKQSPRAY